jgi:hypothetical protein
MHDTHTLTHSLTHTLIYKLTHSHIQTHILSHTLIYTHTHTHIHSLSQDYPGKDTPERACAVERGEFITTEAEPVFDAADILRCGR